MVESTRQIHNVAMELADLARIKKLQNKNSSLPNNYLKAAYELELYAAMKIKENLDTNDQLWRATLLRSAGWLAYKCGYFEQALTLAEIGLEIPTDGYALAKLEELKKSVIEKLATAATTKNQPSSFIIQGFLIAANIESNQINIREKHSQQSLVILVPKSKIQHIAKLFLGSTVQIDAKKDLKGQVVLEDIRWAA